jgi:pimeloyl-ACP methyl ester carboxylesterase
MQFFLSNRHYTLAYRVYGTGSRPLLAFHGFGRTGEDFRIFERELGQKFTIYSFDLPYHGGGKVDAAIVNPAFSKNDLKELIEKFCAEKNINRFSVMGYSLGGKIALSALEVFKGRIENIYLLAPDGLKVNPFYFMGTRTWIGRWLFRSIIKNPQPLLALGNFLEKAKLINPRLNYFVRYHMDTEPKRQKVYDVWILFRKLVPDLKEITSTINENNITLRMFFGKYDNVILPELANKILPKLKNKKDVLHVLECGHRVLERKEIIESIILNH